MDLSYDLFMNAAAKSLNKQGPFMPEELNSKRSDIMSLISQSNHPMDVKNKALTYFFNASAVRQRIKRFLGNKKQVSQPGTKDRAMFEREKLAAEYFQKINNLFGPAIYKLSTSNDINEKKNIINSLKISINVEFKNYLSKTQPGVVNPSAEPGFAFGEMKTNFEDRIADLEQKYLGVTKNKTKTDKPNASSGTIQIPNLVGMSTQQADAIAIQNDLTLNIKQVKSNEPVNTVVTQNPNKGTLKSKGSTVTVFVSQGP
jgi:hypothetical protein